MLFRSPELQLWLDFKNPPRVDPEQALRTLEELDQQWRLKSRTIIELPDWTANSTMHAYSTAGWKISYCIPSSFVRVLAVNRDAEIVDHEARRLIDDANQGGATYLSFDYVLFPEIERILLPHKGNLKLLSWTDLDSSSIGFSKKLASYPKFDGLIIKFNSKYDY